jgi:hypothetical protein
VRWLLWSEDLLLLGVLDALQDLLPPEFVGLVVGLLVEEEVLVPGEPELEAAFGPEL